MVDRAAKVTWLAGLFVGVLAGMLGLIIPFAGVGLAIAATLLVLLRGPRTFWLGGVWLGFGGLWSFFLVRPGVDCALQPSPGDGCSSQMLQTFLVVGILMAVAGLVVSIAAFRGRRAA